jgi:protein TonB
VAEAGKSDITFDTREFKYAGYMRQLRRHIEGVWKYPEDAIERNVYGDLFITFTIRKDGSLGNVRLSRTSGFRSLDDAALTALRNSAPFWPLPEWWEEDGLTINGHFIYTLSGQYVR